MLDEITKARQAVESRLEEIQDTEALESLRIEFLGRKQGRIGELFKSLKSLPPDERKQAGAAVNELKDFVQTDIDGRRRLLDKSKSFEKPDITLPGERTLLGHRHPLNLIRRELVEIFASMGF